jgi:hypothetical protein
VAREAVTGDAARIARIASTVDAAGASTTLLELDAGELALVGDAGASTTLLELDAGELALVGDAGAEEALLELELELDAGAPTALLAGALAGASSSSSPWPEPAGELVLARQRPAPVGCEHAGELAEEQMRDTEGPAAARVELALAQTANGAKTQAPPVSSPGSSSSSSTAGIANL